MGQCLEGPWEALRIEWELGGLDRERATRAVGVLTSRESRAKRITLPTSETSNILLHSSMDHTSPMLFAGRFELGDVLGEGSTGKVWRAYDTMRQREVALKRLHANGLPAALKREFRIACDLVHPGLVSLYELFEVAREVFFTMELVRGVPTTDCFGSSVPTKLDLLRQMVSALLALHGAGLIHRDIKPSNVLVDASGRAVLLDFGLAKPARLPMLEFAGTLAYMAPEQQWGSTSSASDAYSLGLVVFELFHGRLPGGRAPGTHPSAWPVINETAYPGELSAELRRGLVSLLRPDPAERIPLQALAKLVSARTSWPSGSLGALNIVGREHERATVLDALVQGAPGSKLVDVRGEPGIGKTTLAWAVLQEASRVHGVSFARGRCHRRETVPFQAMDEVLHTVAQWAREEDIQVDVEAWSAVFPSIVSDATLRPSPRDPPAERSEAVRALANVLHELGRRRKRIIWLDDFQWCDADSVHIIDTLLHGSSPPPIAWLLTRRRDIEEAESLTSIQTLRSVVSTASLVVDLGPLDRNEAMALFTSLLPREAVPAAHQAVQYLLANVRRTPLWIHQIVHFMEHHAGTPLEESDIHIDRLVAARLNELDTRSIRVLQLVACCDYAVSEKVVLAAIHETNPDLNLAERLCASRFLSRVRRGDAEGLELYHESLRVGISSTLNDDAAVDTHLALAMQTSKLEPGNIGALYQHFRSAGRLEEAVKFGLLVAERASSRLAFQRAADLYAELEELCADMPTARSMAEKQGIALACAGENLKAARVYERLASQATERSSIFVLRAVDQYLTSGNLDVGMALLQRSLAETHLQLPRRGTEAIWAVWSLLRAWLVDRRRKNPGIITGAEEGQFELALACAKGLGPLHPWISVYYAFAALRISYARKMDRKSVLALAIAGTIAESTSGAVGRWGRSLLLRARKAHRLTQDTSERGVVDAWRAQSAVSRGRWRLALHYCERGQRGLADASSDSSSERNLIEMARQRCLEELGQFERMRAYAIEWRTSASGRGDLYAQITADLNLAYLLLIDDRPRECEELARRALSRWPSTTTPFQQFYELRLRVHARLYSGEVQLAADALGELRALVSHTRLTRMDLVRCDYLTTAARMYLALNASQTGDVKPRCPELTKLSLERFRHAQANAVLLRACWTMMHAQSRETLREVEEARCRFRALSMLPGVLLTDTLEELHLSGRKDTIYTTLGQRLGLVAPHKWARIYIPGLSTT